MELNEEVVRHWQSEGSRQVINQGEILPVLMAKQVWERELSHARNLFFLDNEGARESIIRAYSPSWTSRELILQIKIADIRTVSLDWYSRVPTEANCADGPSRLNFDYMDELGAEQVPIAQPNVSDLTRVNVLKLLRGY